MADGFGGEMLPAPIQPQQMMPPQAAPTFTLKVQKVPRFGRACVECIPPEEFRVSRRARSIKLADYHAWQHDAYLADLVREYPDKAHEIDPDGNYQSKPSDISDTDSDVRVMARFPDEPTSGDRATFNEESRNKVVVIIEYIRVDYDGDGIVELRRVKRCGNTILENDIVEESEFTCWSPIHVSHRLIGNAVADQVLDIQKVRTALVRRALDSLARSTAPRTFINRSALQHDPTIYDRLLDHDVGDVIDVDGNPGDVVNVVQTPDVSPTCMAAIEYMDRRAEEATGVIRTSMGINPQAITDTKGGIENLQAAANARVEQYARWIGLALEDVFGKLLRTIVRYQDHAREIKVQGRSLQVDPSRWSDAMTCTVHIGMAAENREKKLGYLNMVLQQQQAVLQQMGPNNPLCSLSHVRNTLARMVNTMGFKDASEFWKQVPRDWQPPPQPPQQDPKLIEAQSKAQLAQQEMQAKMQNDAAERQHQAQLAQQQAQLQAQTEATKGQIQLQIEGKKAENQLAIAQHKNMIEAQLAREKMQQELQLARERMAQEAQLARANMVMRQGLAPKTEPHIEKFRPGGELDA